MGKPSTPQAPDPVATANAQTASNKETAIAQTGLNAINQNTPQGSLTYSQNGTWADGTPKFTATTTLSPEQQKLYNTGIGTQQNLATLGQQQSDRLGGLLDKPFSLSNDATEARTIELANKRLEPMLAQQREAQEASLANRGIRLGSDNYNTAQTQISNNENDARNQLILNGHSQAVQDALTERNQPLNEIIGLASGSQVQSPQFGSTPQTGMAGTDVAGITQGAYNGQMNAYNQQMGQYNSTMGGLFGLGANALMAFSDRDLKTNIRSTGEKIAGVPVKEWDWKDGSGHDVGVIAQELERKHPKLVEMDPSGYRKVNYGGLMKLGRRRAS
ncbi:tail fiber domain-containing protein [Devosia algicola]|uniref:Tail fiber domain-containing protein n=1 Tax=Devosia algicola TaxID=3026418 RepID=A0ABY7YQL6_9HYPH|nr:tail fiber domain-containing protein [Devosia algicola]WDR03621.1 tail fiber domain-containing protein [Devosia algicola]